MVNASIVLYNSDVSEVKGVIDSFLSSKKSNIIYLIDNSPTDCLKDCFKGDRIRYFFTGKNLGYGAAHNISIKKSIEEGIKFHLILNPDLIFSSYCIDTLFQYMESNSDVGHVMPQVKYPNGEIQKLCKLLPSPFDLFIRMFVPKFVFKKQREQFELTFTNYDQEMLVPFLSGCFMFFRTSLLDTLDGFDERFFMYGEDIDISRRGFLKMKSVYYPKVIIVHNHAKESFKSLKMMMIHVRNIIRYFNKWGWLFDSERKKINKHILSQF